MELPSGRETRSMRGIVALTGCDSGIGRCLAPLLAGAGYHVVATYLDADPFEGQEEIESRPMDLRAEADREAFCALLRERCTAGGTLAGVICNAGVAVGGPVENVPMAMLRECFEINFFGTVDIIRAMIPDLIRDRGRILVVGSLAGRIAMPFMAPYASSKYALEGFCDALRRELDRFGVRTVLIEPSAVATPIWNRAKAQDISFVDPKYLDSLYIFRDRFIEGGNSGKSQEAAAAEILGIFLKKDPKDRYIVAKDPIKSKLLTHLPSWLLDRAIEGGLAMKKRK